MGLFREKHIFYTLEKLVFNALYLGANKYMYMRDRCVITINVTAISNFSTSRRKNLHFVTSRTKPKPVSNSLA